jgi:4-amino-4-deoxy-L-arabinose transferase-like glycosyltransferase
VGTSASHRRANRLFAGALLAVVLAAIAVRALPLRSGLPYTAYVDEHLTIRSAAHMIADRTWEPNTYNYPTLLMYANAAASGVLDVLPGGGDVDEGARATVDQPYASNIYSSDLILAGRLVVLAFSAGIVVLSALLASRLMGRLAGIIAALLTATMPALVTRSSIVVVDVPATFFATASLLCASYAQRGRRAMVWAALAGAAAGLAAAAKYSVGVAILAVLAVIAFSSRHSLGDRLRLAGASLVACAFGAVVGAPTLLLRTREVVDEMQLSSDLYSSRASPSYIHELFTGKEIGALLVVVAVIGCLALARSVRTRPMAIGFVVLAIAVIVPFARYPFQPFRNVLPVLPALGVAAAVGVVVLADAVRRLARLNRQAYIGIASAITLVLCGVMIASGTQFYFDSRIDIVDSRIRARQWLADHVNGDDTVLVASEVAFLPSELARIPGHVTVRSLTTTQGPDDASGFDVIVSGDFPSAKNWRKALADRQILVEHGTRVTHLDPRSFRLRGQTIRVFDAPGTQDVDACFPYCG